MSIIRSHSSIGASTIGPSSITPALLTRMSIRPALERTSAITRGASAASVRSAGTTIGSGPAEAIRVARSSRRSARRATIATVAPSAARASAVASPMPLDAPVTTATVDARRGDSVMAGSIATLARELHGRGMGLVGEVPDLGDGFIPLFPPTGELALIAGERGRARSAGMRVEGGHRAGQFVGRFGHLGLCPREVFFFGPRLACRADIPLADLDNVAAGPSGGTGQLFQLGTGGRAGQP